MSVETVAELAAGIDRSWLVAQRRRDSGQVAATRCSVFRAGQLAATYMFRAEVPDLVRTVGEVVARRVGVATFTTSVEVFAATTMSNPDTGREWRPGEKSAYAAAHPGDSTVVDALLTTAADREGNCALVISPFTIDGATVEWLDAGLFDAAASAELGRMADDHAEMMLARSEPFLDAEWRERLVSLGLSGKQAEEAERIAADLAIAGAVTGLLRRDLGDGASAVTLFATPGSVRHQVARAFFPDVPMVDPRKVPSEPWS